MGIRTSGRPGWARAACSLASLLAWMISLAPPGLWTSVGSHSSVVRATEIRMEDQGLIAVCPHHPYGCPKDCMCPKVYVRLGAVPKAASDSSPCWVTCSGHPAALGAPVFSFTHITPAFRWRLCPATAGLPAATPEYPRRGFGLPPLKIPIV